jgi:hypothetical protein
MQPRDNSLLPFIIGVSKKVMESTIIRCESCGEAFAFTS